MPVTILPTTLKYKDESGVWHQADCLRGDTPNLTVGTVTTGEPGTDASVTITGTAEDPVLNFTIPKGAPGGLTQADVSTRAEAAAIIAAYQ